LKTELSAARPGSAFTGGRAARTPASPDTIVRASDRAWLDRARAIAIGIEKIDISGKS
jgi:hypothetical protein